MHSHHATGAPGSYGELMNIEFPGGLRVDVLHAGFRIRTDQPAAAGGWGMAPSPFDLFLASIGACSGYYVLRFCEQRGIPTAGLGLSVTPEREGEHKTVGCVRIEVTLPPGFPDRYREAVLRAVDQCAVKRHLENPPRFEIVAAEPVASVPPGVLAAAFDRPEA